MKIKYIISILSVLFLLSVNFIRADTGITEPTHIATPGRYYLSNDIYANGEYGVCPDAVMCIDASDVYFDLRGHKIVSTDDYRALKIYGDVHNVSIVNGYLQSTHNIISKAIDLTSSLTNITLFNLTLYGGFAIYEQNGIVTNMNLTNNYIIGQWDFGEYYYNWDIGYNNIVLGVQGYIYGSSGTDTTTIWHNNIINASLSSRFEAVKINSLNNSQYGNYWAYTNGTGFSETCVDSDNNGICDNTYTTDGNLTDYKPLSHINLTYYGYEETPTNWTPPTDDTIPSSYPYYPDSDKLTHLCPYDGRDYLFCDNFEYNEPIDMYGWFYKYDNISNQLVPNPVGSYPYASHSFELPVNKTVGHSFGICYSGNNNNCEDSLFVYLRGNDTDLANPDIINYSQINNVYDLWISFDYMYNPDDFTYTTFVIYRSIYDIPQPSWDLINDQIGTGYVYMIIQNGSVYLEDYQTEYMINNTLYVDYNSEGHIDSGTNIKIHLIPYRIYNNLAWGHYEISFNDVPVFNRNAGLWYNNDVIDGLKYPLDRVNAVAFEGTDDNGINGGVIDNFKVWYDTSYSIKGIIRDATRNDKKLGQINVTLTGNTNDLTFSTLTDNYGYFEIPDHLSLTQLPYDSYNITFHSGTNDLTKNSYGYLVDDNGYKTNPETGYLYSDVYHFAPDFGDADFIYPDKMNYDIFLFNYQNEKVTPDTYWNYLAGKFNFGVVTKLLISVIVLIFLGIILSGFNAFVVGIGEIGMVSFLTAINWIPAWVVFLIVIVSVLLILLKITKPSQGGV